MRSVIRAGMFSFALVATVGAGTACKKKNQDATGSGSASASASGSGSASASGSGSATGAPATALTQEDAAKMYAACWGHFNGRTWDDFKNCFAADAVSDDMGMGMQAKGNEAIVAEAKKYADAMSDTKGEAQLTLVNGKNIAAIQLFTGTHDGVMKSPMGDIPATGKKVSILSFHATELDLAQGKATHDWFLNDGASFMGQLGLLPKEVPFRGPAAAWPEKLVVLAKGDATESANVAAYQAGIETFNKHDIKGLAATFAENVVWSEQSAPADQTLAEMTKGLEEFWAGFSDMKLTVKTAWGAGDYVVAVGNATGTNDGTFAAMGLDKTGKKFDVPYVEINHFAGGKVDKAWMFMNSAAFMQQLGLGGPPPGGAPPADPPK